MHRLVPLAVSVLLSGCSALSLAPIVDNNARSYHNVVENVTNSIMVTNILRARDRAPLHYSDLTTINGSLQGTAGIQSVIAYGAVRPGAAGDTTQGGPISLQTTPTFTLGTLDTDDFTRGILTPVTTDVVKHFLDEGIDPRIVFLLFFEGIKGYGVNVAVDGKAVDTSGKINNEPDNIEEFRRFLAIVDRELGQPQYAGLYANAYREIRPVGGPFTLDLSKNAKDIASLDFTKVKLDYDAKTNKYQINSLSPTIKIVFCRRTAASEIATPNGYRIFGVSDTILPANEKHWPDVCTENAVVIENGAHLAPITVSLRSPQGMIEYLGALLRFQEQHRERGPITLGQPPSQDVFFTLTTEAARARFGVDYGGRTYYVNQAGPNDHSLEVLSLVNQLFDLYKSAKDIPNIRPVTIIP